LSCCYHSGRSAALCFYYCCYYLPLKKFVVCLWESVHVDYNSMINIVNKVNYTR
jgi:hypothetical protein